MELEVSPLHHGSFLHHVPWPVGLQAAAAQQSLVPSKLQMALRLFLHLHPAMAVEEASALVANPAALLWPQRLALDILAFCCVMLQQQRAFTPLCKSDTVQGIHGPLTVLMGLFMVLPSGMLRSILPF